MSNRIFERRLKLAPCDGHFFSILDDSDEFVLRAKKMVIETEQELIVRSGETETRYSGRDGRITTKAKYVTSQAEKAQKIQGGTIAIN